MADEQASGTEAVKPEGSASARSPIVFVSDASAEAGRITATLRGAGYVVVEVAVSLLAARVGAQRPNVVLLDVDADGALDQVARLRKLPGSAAIDFLYLGSGEGVVKDADDALENDGSAFFLRPVDVGGLVRKVEALTGGPAARPEVRTSTPPPSLPASRGPVSSGREPSDRPGKPSLPAPGVRTPGPPLPMSTTSLADLVDAPRSFSSFGNVSLELQQLLADAELRAEVMANPDVALPSPEEEIEAVLPADVLASLDEPIHGEDEEEPGANEHPRTGAGAHERDGTGAHARGTTGGGTRQTTTGAHRRAPGTGAPRTGAPGTGAPGTGAPGTGAQRTGAPVTGAQTNERRTSIDAPSRAVTGGGFSTAPASVGRSRPPEIPPGTAVDAPPHDGAHAHEMPAAQSPRAPSSWHPPPSLSSAPLGKAPGAGAHEPLLRSPGGERAPGTHASVVVGPAEARRFFADAIARRATGALCFEGEGVVRRIVMREGDLVAAASGGEHESLVHFLAARGELPRDEAPRLLAKIPPYGRHAGAALVAHGWLRQDQLWQVLRAHAEWIASAVLRLPRGTAQLEPDPPGRLRGEPSVFGAATGAEIFVDLVRRAVPVADALERLGGEGSRITDGPNYGLLAECNLSPQDIELLHRARGGSIADLLARATDGEIVAVVHGLALLGIVEVVPAPDFGRQGERSRGAPESESESELDALDEEAIRARVRARLELVEEGDYFAVLGVTHDATGYEIRRAFIELRRGFEPSRILTPRLLDLTDDVRKIIVVLEEAYEILRDNARRERYRRAIDARPV
jgi:CheY-like chemotaxis protein